MKISTHPKELTREAVEKWLEKFKKKLKRTTSRDYLDRLILSVERIDFHQDHGAGWEEATFENGNGTVYGSWGPEWKITSFQRSILEKINQEAKKLAISRAELKEETGEWILDDVLRQNKISSGGEAIVFEEKFGELEVAVRVQAFDSALFVEENEEFVFEIHLSEDYDVAIGMREDHENVIPFHPNVIKNFANIEIFSTVDTKKEDCIGWITIMERCDSDLRSRLQKDDVHLEERKEIAIGVKEGCDYLGNIGIRHHDKKPENILLKNGEAKWIDFGIIQEESSRESYSEMGYARRGSRYKGNSFLYAGSAAFSDSTQVCSMVGREVSALHIFILCDWKTAWSLLFKPIKEEEKKMIKEELKTFNAVWLSDRDDWGSIYSPSAEEIRNLSKIISLKNAASDFCLDDRNLTKSCAIADFNQKMKNQINFESMTKNVSNEKESNLCVPISVSVLLKWAIENDLKPKNWKMRDWFTLEKIFAHLTMVVCPRSFAGFNLNPKKGQQECQETEIEVLLRRLKYKTYLNNNSGWEILRSGFLAGTFDFEQVLLHQNFTFSRPLTVTVAYLNPNGEIIFHQMVLDRIENSEFVLQNTLNDNSACEIRIPTSREFYAPEEMMKDCFKSNNDFVHYGDNEELIALVNEQFNMETETWYLLPKAYSITLTPLVLEKTRPVTPPLPPKSPNIKVSTHPKELTREAVEEWLEVFKKKLKRTTSRDDLDRLILSVERSEFKDDGCGQWIEVIFQDEKGRVSTRGSFRTEEWAITSFQRTILDKNPDLKGKTIDRSELKEETGRWTFDKTFQHKVISVGGEAIVVEENFGELEVAVRVQAFDSALFTKDEEFKFVIHLSEDFEIAQNKEKDEDPVIPLHSNIIKNFANIEIFSSNDEGNEDCLGWITIMEKCDSDLRSKLKTNELSLEERKKIALGVSKGYYYFIKIGIHHHDKKPENILLKNSEAKWIDFGNIDEDTGRKSYRQMGYVRRGSKYRMSFNLYAGSAAFSRSRHLCEKDGGDESSLYVLLFCDWKTAWSLLFNPIGEVERKAIEKELKTCDAEWLSNETLDSSQIQKVSKIISLKNASSNFCLDDPNLTKSSAMANLKHKLTRQVNSDFSNLTKNVLNQKESNLCVPISVSILLRWALKHDLNENIDVETIFTQLTMIIYPRSLAGFNLNPKREEQKFQENEVELLLKRMKFKTYLNESGWAIMRPKDMYHSKEAEFNYEQVLLHPKYAFSRPLTVTGAYQNPDGTMIFHQMILDRIENSDFILQNTLIDHSGTQIRIPLSREYYASYEMMEDCYNCYNDHVYYGDNNEFLTLVNEHFKMAKEKWYLLPQAYSITFTPPTSKKTPPPMTIPEGTVQYEVVEYVYNKNKNFHFL